MTRVPKRGRLVGRSRQDVIAPNRLSHELVPAHRVIRSMEAESSDASLIADSLTDPEVFGEVFDRHFDSISRFLRRRVAIEVADELTAETFSIALQRRESFDGSRQSARPWLLGIATNLVGHNRRSEARRLRAYARLDRSQEPDFSDAADARSDAAALRWELAEALEELSGRDRDVLLLVAWEGLSYGEVADAMEIPLGTVRSRLSRARQQISNRIPALVGDAEGVSRGG